MVAGRGPPVTREMVIVPSAIFRVMPGQGIAARQFPACEAAKNAPKLKLAEGSYKIVAIFVKSNYY
jgi:hypothetical protein